MPLPLPMLTVADRSDRALNIMTTPLLSLAFVAAETDDAQEAQKTLAALYGQERPEEADIIVALGGDGFMLQTLRETMGSGKKVYGMNRGTIGFLMNEYHEE